ncbi:unnamed protein product [Microthlaspi erraticum]|uniref:MATH domain-containing protein n=1 Tax=Microthlaspi erraticum TaxID=1685480 RepID=A0A6D2L4Y8_9BRAS|nr:unnamed protein product [Microthlaspi erraticum]
MERQVENKFVWVIKHAVSLLSIIESATFVIAGFKWRLSAHPKEGNIDFYFRYCGVADDPNHPLPACWRAYEKLRMKIINRLSETLSIVSGATDTEIYFNEKSPLWSYPCVLSPSKLLDRDGGFLENRELMIVVEEVAHVVHGASGPSDDYQLLSKFQESQGADENRPAKRIIDINGFRVPPTKNKSFMLASRKKKFVAVNGFHVLLSQVNTVKGIFQKYPDFASRFRFKNRHLRTKYISGVLVLIKTLCKPPVQLTYDALDEASYALSHAEKGGFDLDWLERMLDEVRAKKMKLDSGKARIREIMEELEASVDRWNVLKENLAKEKEDMSAARAPLSFDDVV